MSGLLLRIVLAVCTCCFHNMVTLPPWLVPTDFGTCSYQCVCPVVPLFPCICWNVVLLLLLLLVVVVVVVVVLLSRAVRRNKGKFVSLPRWLGPRHENTWICGGTAPRILNFSSTIVGGELLVLCSSPLIPRKRTRYLVRRRLDGCHSWTRTFERKRRSLIRLLLRSIPVSVYHVQTDAPVALYRRSSFECNKWSSVVQWLLNAAICGIVWWVLQGSCERVNVVMYIYVGW